MEFACRNFRGPLIEGENNFFDCGFHNITLDPFMEDYYRSVTSNEHQGFYLADYLVTKKLLNLVDAVLSPISTILLETVLHSKPIAILTTPEHVDKNARSVYTTTTRQIHFSGLDGVGVLRCNSSDDIPKTCSKLLELSQQPETRNALKAMADEFVLMDGPSYGERLCGLVNQVNTQGL